MTEEEHRNAIADAWESQDVAWPQVVALVENALRDYPNSAKLWCVLGDAIKLGGLTEEITPYSPDGALRCYEKAESLDPTCAEAQQEIGYYYDVTLDDPQRAVTPLRNAIRLGAGSEAFVGLARALAQLGDSSGALNVLDECPCADDPEVLKMREEVLRGEWTFGGNRHFRRAGRR